MSIEYTERLLTKLTILTKLVAHLLPTLRAIHCLARAYLSENDDDSLTLFPRCIITAGACYSPLRTGSIAS